MTLKEVKSLLRAYSHKEVAHMIDKYTSIETSVPSSLKSARLLFTFDQPEISEIGLVVSPFIEINFKESIGTIHKLEVKGNLIRNCGSHPIYIRCLVAQMYKAPFKGLEELTLEEHYKFSQFILNEFTKSYKQISWWNVKIPPNAIYCVRLNKILFEG